MSYDLMVFEPTAAPREREAFIAWYQVKTAWGEHDNYNDPKNVTSPRLSAWFHEMISIFPPLNGPLRSRNVDDLKLADYCLGSTFVYVSFGWPQAEIAYQEVRRAAAAHGVGFFDVSGDAEIWLPSIN
jgi:hypothetical protein